MTSERDTKKIEQLQRATCRQLQCLPERTAAVAIYTLIGAEPIETTLDKNAMILFTTLARLDSSIEKDILIWEMENSKEKDRLFICRIRKTLQKYNLPSPEEILENPPKKQQWKNAMKKAINSFWYDKWTNEKQIKSTLEYLEIQQNPIGTPHNILRSVKNRKYDIQKRTIEQNGLLIQIILDCTSYNINQLIPYSNQDLVQIERSTFVLHLKRTEILKNIM